MAMTRRIAQRLARIDEVRSDNSCVTIPSTGPEYDRRRVALLDKGLVPQPELFAISVTLLVTLPVIPPTSLVDGSTRLF
jgi:hypothetical protein